MIKITGVVLLLGLFCTTQTWAQRDALVGSWLEQESDWLPVRLDLYDDGSFRLTAQGVMDQSPLDEQDPFDNLDLDLDELMAQFPLQLHISLLAVGTWDAVGDQLQIGVDQVSIEVEDLGTGNLSISMMLKPEAGMEMTAQVVLPGEFFDLVAGMLEEELGGGDLFGDLELPESLAIYLHMAMSWTTVEDMLLGDITEFDLRINGMDLATFIQQNEPLVAAAIEGLAEAMAAELGLSGEELEAFKEQMVQEVLISFDQEEFVAMLQEELTSLFEPDEFDLDFSMGMEGSYVLAGNTLRITEEDGEFSDWIRGDSASAVALTSWGRLKAEAAAWDNR